MQGDNECLAAAGAGGLTHSKWSSGVVGAVEREESAKDEVDLLQLVKNGKLAQVAESCMSSRIERSFRD